MPFDFLQKIGKILDCWVCQLELLSLPRHQTVAEVQSLEHAHPKELDAHIEVTLWLDARSRCLVEPSEVFGDVSLIPDEDYMSPGTTGGTSRENDFFDITDGAVTGLEENCTVKV